MAASFDTAETEVDTDGKIIAGEIVTVWIDGEPLQARRGQTVKEAVDLFRTYSKDDELRGLVT